MPLPDLLFRYNVLEILQNRPTAQITMSHYNPSLWRVSIRHLFGRCRHTLEMNWIYKIHLAKRCQMQICFRLTSPISTLGAPSVDGHCAMCIASIIYGFGRPALDQSNRIAAAPCYNICDCQWPLPINIHSFVVERTRVEIKLNNTPVYYCCCCCMDQCAIHGT